MEECATAAPAELVTHNEHCEVCRHRGYRPLTSQLNLEHSGRNRHDRSQPHEQPPLSRSALRLLHQRIERERQTRNPNGHSTIIASTRPIVKNSLSGSFRKHWPSPADLCSASIA